MDEFLKSKVSALIGMMEERRREHKGLTALLVEKGLITADELVARMKQVKASEESAVAFMNDQMSGT